MRGGSPPGGAPGRGFGGHRGPCPSPSPARALCLPPSPRVLRCQRPPPPTIPISIKDTSHRTREDPACLLPGSPSSQANGSFFPPNPNFSFLLFLLLF